MEPVINETLVSLFTIVLAKGTVLYKGTSDGKPFNISSNEPCWFALCETIAQKYGPNAVHVRLAEPIKLININSELFNLHFKDCMNLRPLAEKEDILFTLGMPDIETQERLISKNVPKEKQKKNHCLDHRSLNDQVRYYGNKSRYSGTNLDKGMVNAMNGLYGDFVKGYIQPVDRHTCWHVVFPKEVCLFNPSKVVFESITGGSPDLPEYTPPPVPRILPVSALKYIDSRDMTRKEWKSLVRRSFKKEGYSDEHIKDFLKGDKGWW